MGLLSGIDNFTGWKLLQKNAAPIEKAYADSSSAATDIAYFKSVAGKITTPEALLKNFRALTFVATAYGLGSQVGQTAILRKLMTQDPTDKSSLAQQLADNNYRAFATAVSTWNPPPFATQAAIDKVVTAFKQQSFEDSIGTDNAALQEASYFTRNAVGLTKLSQIMSDKPLLEVVRTSLGIPEAFKSLNYDQQVAILKPRVDMKQFATATGVAKVLEKFLAMDALNQVNAGTSANSMLTLFNKSGTGNASTGLSLSAKNFSRLF